MGSLSQGGEPSQNRETESIDPMVSFFKDLQGNTSCETRELSTIIGKKTGLDCTWKGWDWTIQLVTDWIRFNNVIILTCTKKSLLRLQHWSFEYGNPQEVSRHSCLAIRAVYTLLIKAVLCSTQPVDKSYTAHCIDSALLGAVWCLLSVLPAWDTGAPLPAPSDCMDILL